MDVTALDRASEYDRLWFEKHPGRGSYVRPYLPGEFAEPGVVDDDLMVDDDPMVEVTQISPGVRIRRFAPGTILYFS